MSARFCFVLLAPLIFPQLVSAQPPDTGETAGDAASLAPVNNSDDRIAKEDILPNEHGQVFRRYPISDYTSRVSGVEKPQQALIDWILRETGTEVWFSEPLGLLSASKDYLRVYHTPELQSVVRDVWHRFIDSKTETLALALRIVTVSNPNWRSKAYSLMRPVNVQTPGINGWLLTKENAALLIAELEKRTDYRPYDSPTLVIPNGQAHTIERKQPRSYVKAVHSRPGTVSGHEVELGQLDQGFSLEMSPLLSADESTLDCMVRCEVYQVEKFMPIFVDLPVAFNQRQRVQVQVPQFSTWRLHERFRWPVDQVLLISCGVGPTPSPDRRTTLGIPNPFSGGAGRADALLFVELVGNANQALVDQRNSVGVGPSNRGRY